MRYVAWILIISLSSSVAYFKWDNNRLTEENVLLKHEKTEAVAEAGKAKWDGQKEIMVLRDSISASQDSLLDVNKVNKRNVQSITEVKTEKIDNIATETREISNIKTIQPKGFPTIYEKTVSDSTLCWGMIGVIYSIDPDARFVVTSKRTTNIINQVITKEKRFWFIRLKKEKRQMFSACGDPIIVTTTFVE